MSGHPDDSDTMPTPPWIAALDAEDVTPVFDLLERDLLDTEREVVRRSRREGSDPATYSDVVKLAKEMAGDRRSRRASEQQPSVATRLADLERHVGAHRRLIRLAAGGAAAAIVAVATFIYARGFNEGGAAVRLDRVEREVDALRARELDRHSSITPALPAASPVVLTSSITSTKEPTQ